MKKEYIGLKAEKVDFGAYNMVTESSLPPGCMIIVANLVSENGPPNEVGSSQTCINPYDTTQYWYFGNNPFLDD